MTMHIPCGAIHCALLTFYVVGRNELRRMRSLRIDNITNDQSFKNVISNKTSKNHFPLIETTLSEPGAPNNCSLSKCN